MTALLNRIRALRALAADVSNPHESELAGVRAVEIANKHGITEAEVATPRSMADLSIEQRQGLMERFRAAVARSLIRSARRNRLLTKEAAAEHLAKHKDVPKLCEHDKDLLRGSSRPRKRRAPRMRGVR